MKYQVGVYRTVYQSDTVVVDADNEDEACEKAEAMAGDMEFSGGNIEYESEVFEELGE